MSQKIIELYEHWQQHILSDTDIIYECWILYHATKMQPRLMSANGVAEDGHGGFNANGLSVALTGLMVTFIWVA